MNTLEDRETITMNDIAGLETDTVQHVRILVALMSEKDQRIFAAWCLRQIWGLLSDSRSRDAVEILEAFSAGDAWLDDRHRAENMAREAAEAKAQAAPQEAAAACAACAACAVFVAVGRDARLATLAAAWAAGLAIAWAEDDDGARAVATDKQLAELGKMLGSRAFDKGAYFDWRSWLGGWTPDQTPNISITGKSTCTSRSISN